VIAQIDRIIQYQGEEYRLQAGKEAPAMPEDLRKILVKQNYLKGEKVDGTATAT